MSGKKEEVCVGTCRGSFVIARQTSDAVAFTVSTDSSPLNSGGRPRTNSAGRLRLTSTEAGSAARSSPRANAKHAVEAAANLARQLTSSSLATSVRSSGGIGESVLQGPFDSAFDMPGRPHDSRPCPARRKKRARVPIKVKSQLGRGGRSDPLSRYFSRAHEGSVMRQQWSSADWQGDAGSGLCPDPKLC